MKEIEGNNILIAVKFQQDLKDGCDRTCVFMAVSFLEKELERVLKDKLVGDAAFKYELFDSEATLGSFISKIQLSYSLGIISKDVMMDLELIINIKNEFEQDYRVNSFEISEIREKIYDLKVTLYAKYEVAHRQHFNTVALKTLIFIHTGFEIEKFKEKVHHKITEAKRQEMIRNAEEIADKLINIVQRN